jgi:hypothetical protein
VDRRESLAAKVVSCGTGEGSSHVPPSVLLQLRGHGVAQGGGEARVDRRRDVIELDDEGVPGEAGVGGRGGRAGYGRRWAVAPQATQAS